MVYEESHMLAQNSTGTFKRYRLMGICSIVAAILLTVADYLLEFNKEYGVSSTIVETAWVDMSHWRFTFSIYLCMFMIPFYLFGFYLLYITLSKTNKTVALVVSLMFSYGVVMGSPFIHGVMGLNAIIYRFGIQNGLTHELLVSLIETRITNAILPVFLFHYVITWVVAPLILFVFVIRGKSVMRRWTAFLNPFVFLLIGMLGLKLWPQLFIYLAPGSINKGNIAMFAVSAMSMYNGDTSRMGKRT